MTHKSLKTIQRQNDLEQLHWHETEAAAAEGRVQARLDPTAYAYYKNQAQAQYLEPHERYAYWTGIEANLPEPYTPNPDGYNALQVAQLLISGQATNTLHAVMILDQQPHQAQFPASVPMDDEAFWARIKRSGNPVQVGSGYVDVYDTHGQHIARWLNGNINVLYFTPKDQPTSQPTSQPANQTWPPTCPDCQRPMIVRRRRDDGSGLPFWGCANFPHCRGTRPFDLHPEDQATYDAYDPHDPNWSPQANKAARQSRLRRRRDQLLARSLERAQAQGLVDVAASARRNRRRQRLANQLTNHLTNQPTT